jgi:long-subunit fatty acid transport protein
MILRGGLRYEAPRWDVEIDAALEFWGVFDQINTTPKDIEISGLEPGLGSVSVGPLNVPRLYENALSIRVGGDYEAAIDRLWLRAGALWEQSAVPTKTLSVLQVDSDKLAIGLGATLRVGPSLRIDVGYSHIFYAARDVTDSVVEQLNPTNPEGAVVVGNGAYEASGDLFGIGARFDL